MSSFRGFGTQCWVFANWAHKARGGFCEATEQSALPGHSQHQLGTTVDLFTDEWAAQGARTGQGVFRNGFGCTTGGQWLDDNAWRHGFVVPYPIHPDDRKDGSRCEARRDRAVPIDPKTGYKNEPWHLRFIGVDAAARYHDAWVASGPGTPDEITLEQWLRAERGLVGDAELPVCDGCQCGACATLAEDDAATPCGKESLRLDARGQVAAPAEAPHLLDAHVATAPDGSTRIDVVVSAPAHTPTQPPVMGPDGPEYAAGATYLALAPDRDARRSPLHRPARRLARRGRAPARARHRDPLAVARIARQPPARGHVESSERRAPRKVRRNDGIHRGHPARHHPPPPGNPPARRRRARHPPARPALALVGLGPVLALAGLDSCGATELAVDARDALDLPFGREALVEALDAEALLQIGSRARACASTGRCDPRPGRRRRAPGRRTRGSSP